MVLSVSRKISIRTTIVGVLTFISLLILLIGGAYFIQHTRGLARQDPPPPKIFEPFKPTAAQMAPIKYEHARNVLIIGQRIEGARSLSKAPQQKLGALPE